MRIKRPSFEIWLQEPGAEGIYRQVERCGRVCYKSEDHATAGSARPFVERMVRNQHTAMLEHATVYLSLGLTAGDGGAGDAVAFYQRNRFSHVVMLGGTAYVTTNLRVLVENGITSHLDRWLCEPTDHHERRVTVHFTTQIAVTREFNRHRVDSIAEQSTRYCNYSKAKFGNEMTVNQPEWVGNLAATAAEKDSRGDGQATETTVDVTADDFVRLARKVADGQAADYDNWLFANLAAERAYMNLTAAGRKPQEARVVLPLDTNTELVHTAFVSDWMHFFDLRALDKTGPAHPDAKALALPLYNKMKEMGLIR